MQRLQQGLALWFVYHIFSSTLSVLFALSLSLRLTLFVLFALSLSLGLTLFVCVRVWFWDHRGSAVASLLDHVGQSVLLSTTTHSYQRHTATPTRHVMCQYILLYLNFDPLVITKHYRRHLNFDPVPLAFEFWSSAVCNVSLITK